MKELIVKFYHTCTPITQILPYTFMLESVFNLCEVHDLSFLFYYEKKIAILLDITHV